MSNEEIIIHDAEKNMHSNFGSKYEKYEPYIKGFLSAVGIMGAVGMIREKRIKNDYYKKGVEAASIVYKEKFEKLTEAFLEKEKSIKKEKEEYQELIADYEQYIGMLEEKESDVETESQIYFFNRKLEELKGLQETS